MAAKRLEEAINNSRRTSDETTPLQEARRMAFDQIELAKRQKIGPSLNRNATMRS